mmetsp:Transcript_22786/g.70592  ORF Transcript_22786/g.70592 Transcript_22786/m.70592 type:complete len:339 (+) Transcript_22786:1395-2411(+)
MITIITTVTTTTTATSITHCQLLRPCVFDAMRRERKDDKTATMLLSLVTLPLPLLFAGSFRVPAAPVRTHTDGGFFGAHLTTDARILIPSWSSSFSLRPKSTHARTQHVCLSHILDSPPTRTGRPTIHVNSHAYAISHAMARMPRCMLSQEQLRANNKHHAAARADDKQKHLRSSTFDMDRGPRLASFAMRVPMRRSRQRRSLGRALSRGSAGYAARTCPAPGRRDPWGRGPYPGSCRGCAAGSPACSYPWAPPRRSRAAAAAATRGRQSRCQARGQRLGRCPRTHRACLPRGSAPGCRRWTCRSGSCSPWCCSPTPTARGSCCRGRRAASRRSGCRH